MEVMSNCVSVYLISECLMFYVVAVMFEDSILYSFSVPNIKKKLLTKKASTCCWEQISKH